MAPVAARLSLGLEPAQLGAQIEQLNLFPWPRPVRQDRGVAGQVLHADSFGNLITNIEPSDLPHDGVLAAIAVEYQGGTVRGISRTYADASPGDRVALFGSSDLLELAIVQGSAAKELGLRIGDPVNLRW
jgi:S-adenosylmethionine hydrolase